MFQRRFLQFLIFCVCAISFADPAVSYKGTKVVDVLRKFQQRGIQINFSSRLVTSEMLVVEEPKSDSTRAILDEVLNPHGLKIIDGPAKIYLVVKKRDEAGVARPVSFRSSKITEQLDVPFVTVYIGVEGLKDRFITNLRSGDFVLKEDGVEQQITEFVNLSDTPEDRQPLSVLLLIDQSLSMSNMHSGVRRYDFIRTAALKYLEQLRPQDRVMVAGFNQKFWSMSDLTADKNTIRELLKEEPDFNARTALLDILPEAVKQMQDFPNRKILMLCSDGQDSASNSTIETAIHAVQSSDVTIFAIGSDSKIGSKDWGHTILEKITAATGGYAFFAPSEADLGKSIRQIRTAMRSQYAIGFAPRYPTVHKWRDIRVECRIPGVRLRYRNRYLF